MDKKQSVFETLNQIDVSEKIQKKMNLSYLSWAWAWQELKKKYPKAQYKIYENEQGFNYFHDGKTAWVKTGVTVDDQEHIEYLPIMDYKNNSIPVEGLTSFDVNKTIQRSLTKAIARHGLGLYIYAGEDLPDQEDDKRREEVNNISKELKKAEVKTDKAKKWNLVKEMVNELSGQPFLDSNDEYKKFIKDKTKLEVSDESIDSIIDMLQILIDEKKQANK